MQIDLHPATLRALAAGCHLVLHPPGAMSGYSRSNLQHLPAYLVLHVQAHYSDYSRNDYAPFDLHLVLHHVPGQSGGRRPCIRRWRRRARRLLGRRDRLAPSPITIVVAIRRPPCIVGPPMALALTLLALTCALPSSYPRIRQEPAAAHTARALSSHSAGSIADVGSAAGGLLLPSTPGSIFTSAAELVRQKWRLLKATMDERQRRLWAGAEAGA